jgi:hypothetical protein
MRGFLLAVMNVSTALAGSGSRREFHPTAPTGPQPGLMLLCVVKWR